MTAFAATSWQFTCSTSTRPSEATRLSSRTRMRTWQGRNELSPSIGAEISTDCVSRTAFSTSHNYTTPHTTQSYHQGTLSHHCQCQHVEHCVHKKCSSSTEDHLNTVVYCNISDHPLITLCINDGALCLFFPWLSSASCCTLPRLHTAEAIEEQCYSMYVCMR